MIIHYASLADKARRYVTHTLPQIFESARVCFEKRRSWAVGPGSHNGGFYAADVHEHIRARRYVPEEGPQDDVQFVEFTEAHGGDCEDWAAVQLCEFWRRGFAARLVTAGSAEDNFEHVYVEVEVNGRWIPSDPKGSQQGRAFGVRSTHPVVRRWALNGSSVVELPSGSGADAFDAEAARFTDWAVLGSGSYWGITADGSREIISRAVKDRIEARKQTQAAIAEIITVDDDKFVAALVAADLPANYLAAVAQTMGVSGTDAQLREAVADYFTMAARLRGLALRAWLSELGVSVPAQNAVTGSGFIDLKKLSKSISGIGDVVETKLRAVQTGVGVALQQVGAAVAKLEQRAPWAGQFFLRPLGLSLAATAVGQLGSAVRDGSVSAFDEKAIARSSASWFRAVGQALAVAAPFTGPWAPLFTAAAAFNVAVGQTIDHFVDQREAAKRQNQTQVQIYVDRYGRQVDAAGNLLDPTQRAIVQAQLTSIGLAQGQDGFWYGHRDFGPEWGVLWTAHDGGGWPLAVWVDGQWLKVQ